jgi:hypothetical protein
MMTSSIQNRRLGRVHCHSLISLPVGERIERISEQKLVMTESTDERSEGGFQPSSRHSVQLFKFDGRTGPDGADVVGDGFDGPVPPGDAQQPVDVLVRVTLLQGLGGAAADDGVGATSETTTALTVMMAPSPMVTPGMMTASRPIHTPLPITVLPRLGICGRNSAVFPARCRRR